MKLRRYFDIKEENTPIILSCVHGGFMKPRYLPDKSEGVKIADYRTLVIAKYITYLLKREDISISYIFNKIHRSKIDLNRPSRAKSAFAHQSDRAREIHLAFHEKIKQLADRAIKTQGRCLFIDLHGFTKPKTKYPDIIIGHVFGNTLNLKNNQHTWGFDEIHEELSKDFKVDDGLRISDQNLPYSGGYITYQFYHKEKVNAIQLELEKIIRKDDDLLDKFITHFISAIKRILSHVN